MKTKRFFLAIALSIGILCTGATVNAQSEEWCHTFNIMLGYAQSGSSEVGYLHTALDKEGISYAPDTSNIYGTATARAVKDFQLKYGISGTGYFGYTTKLKMNELYGCGRGPAVDIKANGSDGPVSIKKGGSLTLSWTISGAESCTSNWGGTLSPENGSMSPDTSFYTFPQVPTITCTNSAGVASSDSVTINEDKSNNCRFVGTYNEELGSSVYQASADACISYWTSNKSRCGTWTGGRVFYNNDLVYTCSGLELVVTVYSKTNYQGTAASYAVGSYTSSQMQAKGTANNSISSVKVAPGYKVTFYGANNFGGAVLVKTENDSTLVNDRINSIYNWDDEASSMKVERVEEVQPTTCNDSRQCVVGGGGKSCSVEEDCVANNATIIITSPTAGAEWITNSSQTITWFSTDVSYVKIQIVDPNGTAYDQVVNKPSSAGTFTWTVNRNFSVGTGYAIRITDQNDPSVYATVPFSIVAQPQNNCRFVGTYNEDENLGISVYQASADACTSYFATKSRCGTWTGGRVFYNNNLVYTCSGPELVVTAYSATNYGGTAASYAVGSYTLTQMQAKGTKNDSISSVKVAPGYKVTFYRANGFGGATLVKTANDSTFVDDKVTGTKYTNWNDEASSMKVERVEEVQPSITVTSPNGGENIVSTNSLSYSWHTNTPIQASTVYLINQSGTVNRSQYVTFISTVDHTSTLDSVSTMIPPGTYKIKVCVNSSNDNCDLSDDYFTISAEDADQPVVKITSPSDGDTITSKNLTVTGTCSNYSGSIDVYYYSSRRMDNQINCINGRWSTNINIDSNASSGSFDLYAQAMGDASALDKIKIKFNWSTVTPSITVTSPNGGETWKVGETHNITWTSDNMPSTDVISLYLVDSSGLDVYDLNSACPKGSSCVQRNTGSYSWTIPSSTLSTDPRPWPGPGRYKLVVVDNSINYAAIMDSSDGYFTIADAEEKELSFYKYVAYPNQTTITPQTNYKIAHYVLNAIDDESTTMKQIKVDLSSAAASSIENLYVTMGNTTFTTKAVPSTSNSWSINYTLYAGQSVDVKVYADISSNAQAGQIQATTYVSGKTNTTLQDVDATAEGQVISVSGLPAGQFTTSLDASTPVSQTVSGNQQVLAGVFRFSALWSDYTINQIKFRGNGNESAIIYAVLKDGSTVLGTAPFDAINGYFNFTGLSVSVSANTSKRLSLYWSLGPVLTSNVDVKASMTYVKYNDANGIMSENTNVITANSIIVTATSNPNCTDTDGGKDYFTKGTVTSVTGSSTDLCYTAEGRIAEYYCSPEGYRVYEWYTCPNGCSNGACIQTQSYAPQNNQSVMDSMAAALANIAAQLKQLLGR